MEPPRLIACHDCDLLQTAGETPPGGVVRCGRCGAILHRGSRIGADGCLALAMAAAIALLLANTFPIVSLNLQGLVSSTTLPGTVQALFMSGYQSVALMVLLTTIVAPACVLLGTAYVILPLLLGRVPPAFPQVARVVLSLGPWAMVEVMMLGIIVAVVKLQLYASVVAGVGLWSYCAYMLLFTAIAGRLDRRWLWERYTTLRAERST